VGLAAPSAGGSLGGTFQPVKVQSSNAVVSALYSRSGKTYVRAYDYQGTGGEVTLTCAMDQTRASEVDLGGRDVGGLPSTFSVKPWEIKTIKLQRPIE
jgi:hypothetical protein